MTNRTNELRTLIRNIISEALSDSAYDTFDQVRINNLQEGKQVGTIYHYTTFEAGLKILESNKLKSGEAADSTKSNPVFAISFTRDKRFHDNHVVGFDESSVGNKPQLRFTIDGNKLSNRYNVQPYSQQGAFSKDRKGFESEERVISDKMFTIPLSDYLISVDLLIEYKKPSNKYDIIGIVDYEAYAPLRAKIIKFTQDKNLPINLIINKNGDPWPDKEKPNLINKILNFFKKEINETINEEKQVGLLYHYTTANGLKGILQSNKINTSEENYLGNELYYISFTRNKNFHKKGAKFGVSTEYRIALDGDKLSNKYKIKPFAYIPGWDIKDSWELDWLDDEPENVRRDFFNATGDYDEQEERIFFKNDSGIDNIKKYILAVDKIKDSQ
jgi:hypothetical protein